MTEHVHDWEMSGGGMIVCRDHDDSFVVMGNDEALGRLNDREALLAVVPALEDADAWLDAMAIAGIRGWLKPGEQSLYASVHTKIREALAALPEGLKTTSNGE